MVHIPTDVLATIMAVGAFIVPIFTSLLKREHWNNQVKQLIAAVLSFGVAAVVIAVKDPSIFGLGYVTAATVAFSAATAFYSAFFKGSTFESALAAFPPAAKSKPVVTATRVPPPSPGVAPTATPAAPPPS
jgi:hypothetical protein